MQRAAGGGEPGGAAMLSRARRPRIHSPRRVWLCGSSEDFGAAWTPFRVPSGSSLADS